MRRILDEALPWFLTALLLGYIAADALGLFGKLTLAVDGRTETQHRDDAR